jgi:F420-0:gamma-glutamyl ligase
MRLKAYICKTIHIKDNLFEHLNCIEKLPENSVIAIATKVVSLCEGAVVNNAQNKTELAKKMAVKSLPLKNYPSDILTIYNAKCFPNSGIDGSNADGDNWVVYPSDPFDQAKKICQFLKNKYNLKNLGIILTDSISQPFRYGSCGFAVAWWGMKPLINKIGTNDCFGKVLNVSQVNIVDALASAAVICMGEGNEHKPFVAINNIAQIEFTSGSCTLDDLEITEEIDMYQELFTNFK